MICQLRRRTATAATATLLAGGLAVGLAPAEAPAADRDPAGIGSLAGPGGARSAAVTPAGAGLAPGPELRPAARLRPGGASRSARTPVLASALAPGRTAAQAAARASARRAKALARRQLAARGWSRQFGCLERLWTRESHWNARAGHPARSYGIPQANPGRKMRSAGRRWRTDPGTQIRWGLGYIDRRYGSPCGAWRHWQRRHWY